MQTTFRNFLYTLFAFIGFLHQISAQDCLNFEWAKRAECVDGDDNYYNASDIVIDTDGNLYITGSFEGTATFGATVLNSNGEDMFVAMMDPSGAWVWAIAAGSDSTDTGEAILIDGSGNLCITGNFSHSAVFGEDTLVSSGKKDFYVARLTLEGEWIWAKGAGGSGNDYSNAIAVNPTGSLYITGTFSDTLSCADSVLVSNGYSDIFIAGITSSGDWLWAVSAGGTSYGDNGNGIAVDQQGNLYVAGSFNGTVDFGAIILSSTGGGDSFVAKLSPQGEWQWVTQGDGSATAIVLNNAGEIFITGSFTGTAHFGTTTLSSLGFNDVFAARLNASGEWQWAIKAGSTLMDIAYKIVIDQQGDLYVAGQYEDSKFLLAKINPAGSWYAVIRGGSRIYAYSVAIDPSGDVFITGQFGLTTVFRSDYSLLPTAYNTIYIAKATEGMITLDGMENITIHCGETAQLQTNATNYTSLNWSPGISSSQNGSSTLSVTPSETKIYTLQATNICNQTLIESVTVEVIPYTISASAASTAIDCGTSTQLNATSTAVVPVTYSWTPAIGLSDASIPNPVATPLYNQSYAVSATTASGCYAGMEITITVNNPNPVEHNSQTICAGESYTINGNTYTVAGTYLDVALNAGTCGSPIITELTVNPVQQSSNPQVLCPGTGYTINGHTYTLTGNYIDTLQSITGCDSIVNTLISISPNIIPTVSYIDNMLVATQLNATYQWIDCNSGLPVPGATQQTFIPSTNGSYAVEISRCGLQVTSSCIQVSDVGLEENNPSLKLGVYPNPAGELLNVTIENGELKRLIVTDLKGRLIQQLEASGTSAKINLEHLSSGIYLLKAETGSFTAVTRFVKD